MSSPLSKIPSGVQYIFDEQARLRRWIERELMAVFEGWSYSEIILPIFDYADLFALGMGKEQAELTYRFTGRDGKLLALRPEMTSLVARTVATRFQNKPRPIRLCYSGEVFRWDEPRSGRQYEFHQIGLEHIGSERLEADTEAIIIAVEALRRIGLEHFTITVGHVEFFNGIAESLALDETGRRQMQTMIDRKESDELRSFLTAHAASHDVEGLCRVFSLSGGPEIIQEAKSRAASGRSIAALDDLDRVYQIAKALGLDRFVNVDLGEVGGLDYYTGLTFRIYAQGLGAALGRGGRYDQFLAKFGQSEPAVGFSLCLDWLAGLLSRGGQKVNARPEPARIPATDSVSAFKAAVRLRGEGRSVEIH